MLNHQFYTRCPRAIFLEETFARYLVGVYFDCKNMNMYPAPGGPLTQTAFTMDLFNYIDGIKAETERKNDAAQKSTTEATAPKRK